MRWHVTGTLLGAAVPLPLRGWEPGLMPANSLGQRRWGAHHCSGAWKPPRLGPAQAPSPFPRGEQWGEAGAIGARDRIPELYHFVAQDLEALRKRSAVVFTGVWQVFVELNRRGCSMLVVRRRRVVVPSCILPGAPIPVFLSLVAMSLSTP